MDCKRCKAMLIGVPEYFRGDWGIDCHRCSAFNIVSEDLVVLGWRKKEENQ